MCMCACLCIGMCITCVPGASETETRRECLIPGTGIAGGCEPPNVGAKNGLCKIKVL